MKKGILLFYFIVHISCTQNKQNNISFRDSVLHHYLSVKDSAAIIDSSSLDYTLLRAYAKNDTLSLKIIDSISYDAANNRANWNLWTSDIPLPSIDKLHADEVYRFIFSVYDSPVYEAITIYKKTDSCRLHYAFYKHDRDSSKFNFIKEFTKPITKNEWQEALNKINESGFWRMMPNYDYRGNDGSDLSVFGYQKSGNFVRSHSVHRFVGGGLDTAFYYLYFSLLNKNERAYFTE